MMLDDIDNWPVFGLLTAKNCRPCNELKEKILILPEIQEEMNYFKLKNLTWVDPLFRDAKSLHYPTIVLMSNSRDVYEKIIGLPSPEYLKRALQKLRFHWNELICFKSKLSKENILSDCIDYIELSVRLRYPIQAKIVFENINEQLKSSDILKWVDVVLEVAACMKSCNEAWNEGQLYLDEVRLIIEEREIRNITPLLNEIQRDAHL